MVVLPAEHGDYFQNPLCAEKHVVRQHIHFLKEGSGVRRAYSPIARVIVTYVDVVNISSLVVQLLV